MSCSGFIPTAGRGAGRAPFYAPSDDGAGTAGIRGSRVLIVEDDHFVALATEAAILDAGLEVVGIVASADEAVRLAKSLAPDVVIMDVTLVGNRDGVDAALELFRDTGLRCIFASAHHDPHTRARAEAAQPFAWLPKPYQPETLVLAVQDALKRSAEST